MAGRLRNLLSWTILSAAAGVAGLGLAAVGGAWNGWLDRLTHLAPLILAAAAAVLILALVRRGPRWKVSAVLAGVAMVCTAGLMTPELARAARGRAAPTAGRGLTLMTLNLWLENVDPEATARMVLAADPDVLVLEEATGKGAIAARLLRARYPYAVGCEGPTTCALAIYSKIPIIAGAAKPQDWDHRPFDTLRMVWARIGARGTPAFTVVGTRLGSPTQPPWLQAGQRRRLAKALEPFARSNLIVAGDFNTTPWSFAMREQDRLMVGLQRRTVALPTWPARWLGGRAAPLPLLPIDHIYAGRSWRTVSIRRGPRTGSDHYPVIAVLARE